MKKILLIIALSFITISAHAQKTYTDENDLLTFTYPDEWKLLAEDGIAPGITDDVTDIRIEANPYTGLDKLDIESIEHAEYRQMLQYYLSSALNTVFDVTDYGRTKLGGADAYYMILLGTNGERAGKNLYFIQTQTPNSIVSIYIEGPEDLVTKESKVLEDIISSLKFN